MRDYDIESDLKQEKFQSLKLVQGDKGNKIKINVYEEKMDEYFLKQHEMK